MKSTGQEFRDIKSVDQMHSFLINKGNNHLNYHHYTNLTNAISIISSEYWYISRGNSIYMNDQHESLAKGSQNEWGHTYIASFVFGDNENMAMWGLYGLPREDAVRITIPRKEMITWINNCEEITGVEFSGDRRIVNQPFKKILTDIVYIEGKRNDRKSKLFWNDNSIMLSSNSPIKNIDTSAKMTGLIKNAAWKYENEVRIHIRVDNPMQYEKIAIKIPEYVIKSMIITGGPCTNDIYERINKEIPDVIKSRKTSYSRFKDLVNYRTLCSMCKHSSFARKTG